MLAVTFVICAASVMLDTSEAADRRGNDPHAPAERVEIIKLPLQAISAAQSPPAQPRRPGRPPARDPASRPPVRQRDDSSADKNGLHRTDGRGRRPPWRPGTSVVPARREAELFEPTDQGTRCEIAVRQVLDYVKARLLEKNRDIVGLVACGPDEAAVTLLTPAAPSAKAARALGEALKTGKCATPQAFRKWLEDDDEITQKPRNRTDARQGRLRNGLDRCARDLEDASKGPSAVDSIYIFSGAKDPLRRRRGPARCV